MKKKKNHSAIDSGVEGKMPTVQLSKRQTWWHQTIYRFLISILMAKELWQKINEIMRFLDSIDLLHMISGKTSFFSVHWCQKFNTLKGRSKTELTIRVNIDSILGIWSGKIYIRNLEKEKKKKNLDCIGPY